MMMRPTIERYCDGAVVFREGELGDRMYIVMSGAVRIFREDSGTETTLARLGFGETFGELALFDQHPRSATAQAVGDTELRVISQEEFMDLDCDMIIRRILITLAERLRAMNQAFGHLSTYGTTDEELVRVLATRDWLD
ncbi:MAG TPA: cyclic nucleotide-binding domain-containing protein [Coriobacteriia bacterium]